MEEKVYWQNRVAFILASMGSAIGLGNVWRFPYICYKYGGGAFLFAYVVVLMLIGIPLLILEFGIGYKFKGSAPYSLSQVRIGNINFEFIGWFAILVGFCITTYYSVIMGWSFDYLFYTLKTMWGDAPKEFFYKNVLGLTDSVFNLGKIPWHIVIGLLLSWVWIVLSIWKGAKTVGKVVYVTVTLPWILLIVFVIRGLALPGAFEGIKYYLTPSWEKLLSPELWQAAISQCFFSLTVGFGVMIAYASFLPPKSDIVNNAFLVGLADAATAYIAGFAVFSTLGYYAYTMGVSVSDVMKSGPELAFCTYPTIISKLPFAPLFGIMFFVMLLTLAIDSAFSLVEGASASFIDKFKIKRWKSNVGISIIAFLLGIIYTTGAGLYWLDIMDHFMNNFGLFLAGFLECIIIGYIYGSENMKRFINEVSERKIGKWWNISILIIVPISAFILLLVSIIERIKSPYGGYPRSAEAFGWGSIILFLILSIVFSRITKEEK